MKLKNAVFGAALVLALSAASAFAADAPHRKVPPLYIPPPPPPMWTGFYAGVNLGGGWLSNDRGSNSGGFVGGGQVGYNFQISPMFVVGVEADFQGASIGGGGNANFAPWAWGGPDWGGPGWGWAWAWGASPRVDWFGTVRGRAGVLATPALLLYGTAGFAYGGVRGAGWWVPWQQTETGWTAGGGAEWMFVPGWSAKAEYLYTDISSSNDGGGNWGWGWSSNVQHYTPFHTIRAGVNYHFDFGGATPVVARY
jgi:outer membrane immunogenic protein